MRSYKYNVNPYSSNFVLIELHDHEVQRIDEFCERVIQHKEKESHYKVDYGSMYKRFYTGTAGELALEKLLDIQGIVNWTVGLSKDYNTPDLADVDLNVGVKTVGFGVFPLVRKESTHPQIICILWKKKWVYVCGIASVNTLNTYQDDKLILDDRLRCRGVKSGFYGFKHLKPFKNINELKNIANEFKKRTYREIG